MYIPVLVIFISGLITYYFNGFDTAANVIAIKRRQMGTLSVLIKSSYKNILKLCWICFLYFMQSMYISFIQTVNKSLVRVDKNTYMLRYTINGVLYTMLVTPKRGPKLLLQALDANDNDITEQLQSYLGPAEDFHGLSFYPRDFSTTNITVNLSTGDELTFSENDKLSLSV